jgi:pimeloyl-ACP methyl ester carboxylesterase
MPAIQVVESRVARESRFAVIKHDVRGEGSLVLLLHSGGMSGRQWRRLAERLAPSHRVVSPDFLGSGDNPPWPADTPFDFHSDVAAISQLLDVFGAPAHLVGHSYGGLIALTVARERPAAVRSLTVYDPVAFGVLHGAADEEGLADLARAGQNPVFLDDERGGQEPWFEAFVDYWNGPGSWLALPPPARASFLKVGRKVYGEVRSLLEDRTPATAYAHLRAPALLLTGEHSPAAARRVVALLAAALPSARLESVAGAGHMGPISQATEVNAQIERHIAAAEENR